MTIRLTARASDDLVRLHDFLKPVASDAAARVILQLANAPERLVNFPRIGEKIDTYAPREVRRIMVGHYEMRYEIADGIIYILRVWHLREYRGIPSAG